MLLYSSLLYGGGQGRGSELRRALVTEIAQKASDRGTGGSDYVNVFQHISILQVEVLQTLRVCQGTFVGNWLVMQDCFDGQFGLFTG